MSAISSIIDMAIDDDTGHLSNNTYAGPVIISGPIIGSAGLWGSAPALVAGILGILAYRAGM